MESKKINRSDFFAGYRRIFDPYNDKSKIKVKKTSFDSDKKNMQKDWIRIGKYIEEAITDYDSKQRK